MIVFLLIKLEVLKGQLRLIRDLDGAGLCQHGNQLLALMGEGAEVVLDSGLQVGHHPLNQTHDLS